MSAAGEPRLVAGKLSLLGVLLAVVLVGGIVIGAGLRLESLRGAADC